MLLIGQYDSPFVRRVGIALTLFRIAFRHELWSVFRQAETIAAINPLMRIPTLVLDDGTVLNESHVILDYLESFAPEGQGLFPREEPHRHRVMRISALACGIGDKAVSLFYEKRLHDVPSETWVNRCQSQILASLALLERECAAVTTPYWFGTAMTHADIAVTVILRFVREAHPGLVADGTLPHLAAFAARLEALPVFQAIQQEFIPPA